jgi:hypothetical protein
MGWPIREPMPGRGSASQSRTQAEEYWRDSLESNHSIFWQLVYLGSLRDAESGVFIHEGLELRCGKERAREVIGNECTRILKIWLGYDRTQQETEIRDYFGVFEEQAKCAGAGARS